MGLFQKAMLFKAGKRAFSRYQSSQGGTSRPGARGAARPGTRGMARRGGRRRTGGTIGRLASSLLGGRRRV